QPARTGPALHPQRLRARLRPPGARGRAVRQERDPHGHPLDVEMKTTAPVRTAEPLLEINGLHTYIPTPPGGVRAPDAVSRGLRRGEAAGIVGEPGSGRSVLARSVMGLLPPEAVRSGRIAFDGQDLLTAGRERLHQLWGARLAIVFQDPSRSLNPSCE